MGKWVDRSQLVHVQTPQAFRLGVLRAAHREHDRQQQAPSSEPSNAPSNAPSDDSQMVRAIGVDVVIVEGDSKLHKLTRAEDLPLISASMAGSGVQASRTAVGFGYDVHRLVAGKPLWLGGVEIAHSHGLRGHSDADVALHALTDALLGALSEGDIGEHFPPSDPQWKEVSSRHFLTFARERLMARGGSIEHLDLTLIAESPKIAPHRQKMRVRIAEILAIPLEWVSVKATTTEKLGFAGRGEGIAAQAVVVVYLER